MQLRIGRWRVLRLICIAAIVILVVSYLDSSLAAGKGKGKVKLPKGEIARLSYEGFEKWNDNGDIPGVIDAGDSFEGIIIIREITNLNGTVNFSRQLKTRELTAHFNFTVVEGALFPPEGLAHIEFALTEGDFFRLYVGTGRAKNYDPEADDAIQRASDGNLWIAIEPGTFFESVNDLQPDFSTLNRAWMVPSVNNSRYPFVFAPLPTLLGKDPTHEYEGAIHEDHDVQVYFENQVASPEIVPPALGFTFFIFGDIYVQATE